jgi:hypothetical protein
MAMVMIVAMVAPTKLAHLAEVAGMTVDAVPVSVLHTSSDLYLDISQIKIYRDYNFVIRAAERRRHRPGASADDLANPA